MAKDLVKITADFSTTLASKVAIGATTATLSSIVDDDGTTIPNGFYGFTIDRKNTSKEYITATLTGTALSNIKTITRTTGDESAGFAKEHRKGAEVIISDFVAIKRIQDVLETGYASATTPSTDYQLATKKYVDDLALGGTTTVDRVTVIATCGQNVTAGQLLYLKVSDSKWWKCDADDLTTIDNVVLGIAQGAGTANGLISGGVLVKGVDGNLAGLTANSLYYASNTAGGVSATTGTYTRIIGVATAADKLYFDPEFNKAYKNYAVDSVGSDSYAITLQSAFGAYYAGMEVSFKAGTANTGACTLNVNGLGAKAIKKDVSTDLVTGDILQNQIVKVIYDGTNFQLISKIPQGTINGATQITGTIPLTNLPVPMFEQNIYSLASSNPYASTANQDGSVFVIRTNNTSELFRFERDSITGYYKFTHNVNMTQSGGAIIILGSYVYNFYDTGATITSYRYNLANLTSETLMTIPSIDVNGSNYNTLAWTDGTYIYLKTNKADTTYYKLSVSGTTFTQEATGSTVAGLSAEEYTGNYFDGTNIYVSFGGGTSFSVYKLADAVGSGKTLVYSSDYLPEFSSENSCGILIPIDGQRLYIGQYHVSYDASAANGRFINLVPLSVI